MGSQMLKHVRDHCPIYMVDNYENIVSARVQRVAINSHDNKYTALLDLE